MESFYEDDIDIIGADDIIDGHCTDTSPDPLIPKFYVGTATHSHNSASHLALQKAYSDLKKRYNDLAQRSRERSSKTFVKDTDFSGSSRETQMEEYQDICMHSMAQAAGAEMPEMSSEQKAQLGYTSYLQRKLVQETARLQRFEIENKSLKDKLVDIEGKYKICLREKERIQQDLEVVSQEVINEKTPRNEKSKSDEQLICSLKDEAATLHSELLIARQEIFENKKTISDLSKRLESSDRQLKDKIVDEQNNRHRESSELYRTRELLSEREQEISQLRKERSSLMADIDQQNRQSIAEKNKMDTSNCGSALEDISIHQMNQNDWMIKKLQSETHQQAKLIQQLIERVTEKQNLNSVEPQLKREVPGTSYLIAESPRVQIPTVTGTGFSKHHASPLQREISSRDTKMECATPGYVSLTNVTLGNGSKSPVRKSPIRSVLSEPVAMRPVKNDSVLVGHDLLTDTHPDSCLNYQNGLVSFNLETQGMVENAEIKNPYRSTIRNPSENTEDQNVSDSTGQYIFLNHEQPTSQTVPLAIRQPTHRSYTGDYDNFENNYMGTSKRSSSSSSGLNNGSLFKRVSSCEMFSEVYSAEPSSKMTQVPAEPKHRQICPVCSQDFSDLSMESFQTHVFDCFDNEAEPPETLRPQEENNERKCPMCESVFPENIVPQDDFEKHVQSHFGEDAISITDRFEILRP